MVRENAARGALLGLACGDALGRPIEFQSPGQIREQHGTVTEMLGYGTHGQPAGTITDDTEMALCIARSLVEEQAFDGADVADRFLQWYQSDPFDIGLMTADALGEYESGTSWWEAGRQVWERRAEGSNAGNGSVMRCTPHALAFCDDPETLTQVSEESSAITHYDPRCTWGCVVLNRTVAGFVRDEAEPLQTTLEACASEAPDELLAALRAIPDNVRDSQLSNTGYVVDTLQTALYDGLTAESAETAIVNAVNRGGDADTIGAVAGAVAGARFGVDGLPDRWLATLHYRDELESLARELIVADVDLS